ncbi:hypothetical protein HBI68_223460 [Parastagonospora nodorum]|nr:hypothetical protein HBI48_232320 [Parastagonospora nodorum]KAH5777502.1 hypothetical protein HBI97_127720 [Parastagonospora nodorum]KAH6139481.1 hypothetical protein HBI68_223460 [Parastagonospora nodorum]
MDYLFFAPTVVTGKSSGQQLLLLLLKLYNLIDRLTANKLPCLALIALLKLLKEILFIAIRIYYCIILYYLVYKHSCLLAYYSLIYIRIISRDRVTKKRIYLNIY